MKIIAVVNLKGGVAKTTTCINTAYILATEYNKRVLVIDADSQCNTTEFLQRDGIHPETLSDLLKGRSVEPELSRYNNIDIVPADENLMDLDLTKVETGTAKAMCIHTLLSDKLADFYD